MATAFLFPLANLFARLQAFAAWLAPRPAPVPCVAVHTPVQRMAALRPAMPLRVVRVLPLSSRTGIALARKSSQSVRCSNQGRVRGPLWHSAMMRSAPMRAARRTIAS